MKKFAVKQAATTLTAVILAAAGIAGLRANAQAAAMKSEADRRFSRNRQFLFMR